METRYFFLINDLIPGNQTLSKSLVPTVLLLSRFYRQFLCLLFRKSIYHWTFDLDAAVAPVKLVSITCLLFCQILWISKNKRKVLRLIRTDLCRIDISQFLVHCNRWKATHLLQWTKYWPTSTQYNKLDLVLGTRNQPCSRKRKIISSPSSTTVNWRWWLAWWKTNLSLDSQSRCCGGSSETC